MAEAGVGVGAAAAVVTGLTVLAAGALKLVRLARRVGHLVDDLVGEPPRPGNEEGRPGLMERVASLEERVAEVRHEVQHNDGGSLKDAVKRTETAVAELTQRGRGPSAG